MNTKTKPIIYYRDMRDYPGELDTAQKYFKCVDSILDVQPNDLVIGRYSVVPFYKYQEKDITKQGAQLINSFRQHKYVADLGNWVHHLDGLTPKTWQWMDQVPDDAGPFVLKGETNSKKFQWDTHMFAADKKQAIEVMCRLQEDGWLSDQHIYIRQYIPLETFFVGARGLPITREFRFFIYKNTILSGGFYWGGWEDEIDNVPSPLEVPDEFLNKVIAAIGDNVNFYVVDIAKTQSGEWIVIELNDGQQSGLSDNDPDVLYRNLSNVLGIK